MEDNPLISVQAADGGNPNFSIQTDNKDEGSPSISTDKPCISSQADEDKPCIPLHADAANLTTAIQADDSTPSIPSNLCVSTEEHRTDSGNPGILDQAQVIQPNISAPADLNSNLIETVQETVESMEEFQENKAGAAVLASIALLTPSDAVMVDGTEEGQQFGDTIRSLPEHTLEERGKLENEDSAFGNFDNDVPVYDDSNEEFLPIGDVDENVTMDKETIFVNGEGCEGGESNDLMQADIPWSEGSIDALGTVSEPQDGNRRLSLKRSRSSSSDSTPSVQVIYKCLTSKSKNKLKELLQQWAQWHAEFVGMEEGSLESGDETYFPPLQVGGASKATMSFWMDKPSKQARTENTKCELAAPSQDREKEVPLYDRAGTGALISQETEMSLEGGLERVDEGSRCFNCGSYSHSLKECPRPRDNAAINNARKLLAEKRGSANGSRSASRYYQSSPGGKFDDLKPGFLGSETRQLLGIGELDPPPWLNRMRELGYPPGYLEDQEEEQSGITIFGTSEDAEGSFIGEEGEIVGENKKKRSTSKKMIVHFPGVNAPIPDDADRHTWGSAAFSGHDRASHRVVGRSAHSSSFSAAAVTSDGTVYTGTEDWEGPPGSSRDSYSRSSRIRSPGFEGSSTYNKTPPWQASEQGRLGNVPSGRSPHLGRSSSDSGRRSPKVAYDEPHSLPPLGGVFSNSRQSPLHSSRPYQSPSTPNQRHPYSQESRDHDSRRRAWAQAHDALQSMHRSDRPSPSRRR
eukprot:c1998_g1_i1 orf=251-2491(+)